MPISTPQRVGRQPLRPVRARTRSSDGVDDLPALRTARIGVERLQRRQRQDAPGIDRVGVAHQPLDVGGPQLARPGGERRARLGREPAAGVGPAAASSAVRPGGHCGGGRDRAAAAGRGAAPPAAGPASATAWSARRSRPWRPGSAPPRARRRAVRKSWAAMPIACSAGGRPSCWRMARLSHGPASTAGGQPPSLSPPISTRSAWTSRLSSWPRMARRGCAGRSRAHRLRAHQHGEQGRIGAGRHLARPRRRHRRSSADELAGRSARPPAPRARRDRRSRRRPATRRRRDGPRAARAAVPWPVASRPANGRAASASRSSQCGSSAGAHRRRQRASGSRPRRAATSPASPPARRGPRSRPRSSART